MGCPRAVRRRTVAATLIPSQCVRDAMARDPKYLLCETAALDAFTQCASSIECAATPYRACDEKYRKACTSPTVTAALQQCAAESLVSSAVGTGVDGVGVGLDTQVSPRLERDRGSFLGAAGGRAVSGIQPLKSSAVTV